MHIVILEEAFDVTKRPFFPRGTFFCGRLNLLVLRSLDDDLLFLM